MSFSCIGAFLQVNAVCRNCVWPFNAAFRECLGFSGLTIYVRSNEYANCHQILSFQWTKISKNVSGFLGDKMDY